jgi:hypothetical protein
MSTRTYGGLKDQDRIFQNIYGEHDFSLKGAMKLVSSLFIFFLPIAMIWVWKSD